MKFNIGDRVQTISTKRRGTVRGIPGCLVAVELDDRTSGVPIPKLGIANGLFLMEEDYEKISPSKIVITSNGKTTLARLYAGDRVIRRAEAKCSPEDTYDFATGADLAYDRLMQPPKPTAPANKYDAMSDDDLSWIRRPMSRFVAENLEDWNSRVAIALLDLLSTKEKQHDPL